MNEKKLIGKFIVVLVLAVLLSALYLVVAIRADEGDGVVDTTAPQVKIDSGPSGIVKNRDWANFTFSGTDTGGSSDDSAGILAYSYRLDGGKWSKWAYPEKPKANFSDLSLGNHVFEVKAKDEAGNESSVASRSFKFPQRLSAKLVVSLAGVDKTTRTIFTFEGALIKKYHSPEEENLTAIKAKLRLQQLIKGRFKTIRTFRSRAYDGWFNVVLRRGNFNTYRVYFPGNKKYLPSASSSFKRPHKLYGKPVQ